MENYVVNGLDTRSAADIAQTIAGFIIIIIIIIMFHHHHRRHHHHHQVPENQDPGGLLLLRLRPARGVPGPRQERRGDGAGHDRRHHVGGGHH